MFKKKEIFIFILSLLIGSCFLLTSCVQEQTPRIRIKASDDSVSSVEFKDQIKDEVLMLLSKTNNQNIDFLVQYLKNALNEKYSDITVSYTNDTYPAKSLNGEFIPSGTYPTLLIIIGEGLGSNWWSLLYPEFFNVSYDESDEIEYRSYVWDKYQELH